eukprot:c12347_g1_i2.p1 GENE.c12347_g1_i2~~c12347_g1_i2.p1  ORF type:complete len:312 (-),score=102.50 c12347_g1_i2:11-907(-)
MTTRNITPLFLSFRQTMHRHPSFHDDTVRGFANDGRALLSHTSDMEMGNIQYEVPPVWLSTVDQVKEYLVRIKKRLDELKIAHEKHLLPGFDDMDPTEEEVEVLISEISRLFKTSEAKIRFLGKEDPKISQKEAAVLRNLQSLLAQQLSELHSQFRKSQKTYLQKLKGQQKLTDDPIIQHKVQDEEFFGFTAEQKKQVLFSQEMIAERDREIGKVTESIVELATMFKDLQTLVIDQGTILDRIDYNLEQAHSNIEHGVKKLKDAEKAQKKDKLVLCIIILALICGFLMLALIVKFSNK